MVFVLDIFVVIFSLWLGFLHRPRGGEVGVYMNLLLLICFIYMILRWLEVIG